jgi:hypothetical protein
MHLLTQLRALKAAQIVLTAAITVSVLAISASPAVACETLLSCAQEEVQNEAAELQQQVEALQRQIEEEAERRKQEALAKVGEIQQQVETLKQQVEEEAERRKQEALAKVGEIQQQIQTLRQQLEAEVEAKTNELLAAVGEVLEAAEEARQALEAEKFWWEQFAQVSAVEVKEGNSYACVLQGRTTAWTSGTPGFAFEGPVDCVRGDHDAGGGTGTTSGRFSLEGMRSEKIPGAPACSYVLMGTGSIALSGEDPIAIAYTIELVGGQGTWRGRTASGAVNTVPTDAVGGGAGCVDRFPPGLFLNAGVVVQENVPNVVEPPADRIQEAPVVAALVDALTGLQPPQDSDGDGVPDSSDQCPTVPASTPDGCPAPPQDSDGDGVPDSSDQCPTVPASTPDGCPPPGSTTVQAAPTQNNGFVHAFAAPGTVNTIEVMGDGPNAVVVTDQAGVHAGSGCTSLGPNSARCTTGSLAPSPAVYTADRNDSVTFRAGAFVNPAAFGEGGDDSLVGGSGSPSGDYLSGGDGADALNAGSELGGLDGGSGDDTLMGGPRNDHLFGSRGADVMSGGAGLDLVDYYYSSEAVTASIDGVANDGVPGDGGNIGLDIEGIQGSANFGDTLTGGTGADGLYGYGGNDRIEGGFGQDQLYGYSGDDTLLSRDGQGGETVSCDAGADSATVDPSDLHSSCETLMP